MVPEVIKRRVLAIPRLRAAWTRYRASTLHREYVEWRERYESFAAERGVEYREGEVATRIRERLASRGCAPALRKVGEIHTFTFIPRIGWHSALFGDLRELGPVTEFDPARGGY